MKVTHRKIAASVAGLALLALVAAPGPAAAHDAGGPMQYGHAGQAQGGIWNPPGMKGRDKGGQGKIGGGHTGPGATQPGMMGQGMMPMMQMHRQMIGSGMKGHGMMGQGMMGQGMMGQGMMGQGMMGQGMMGQGTMPMMHRMRSRMMGLGIGGHGMRVVPGLNLSADDVRQFLKMHLNRIGNKRLKVGEVTLADDGSIVADVVTIDDSLVQRFKVNRHSGWMQPAE